MSSPETVSVVIPTTARTAREYSLQKAISSVTTGQRLSGLPLVVVNGQQYDEDVLGHLKQRSDIRFFYRPEGNLAAALRFGREQVDTEFFCFLDDDDFLLPLALEERVEAMVGNREVDVIVTDGLRQQGNRRVATKCRDKFDRADPLGSLLAANWLASCGRMFRTATVVNTYFNSDVRGLEWTYIAFLLSQDKTIAFLESENPHFVICDTTDSASKSFDYLTGSSEALERMLRATADPTVKSVLKRKISDNWHCIAGHFLVERNLSEAWVAHWKSLVGTPGCRYIAFSRRFVRPIIRRVFRI